MSGIEQIATSTLTITFLLVTLWVTVKSFFLPKYGGMNLSLEGAEYRVQSEVLNWDTTKSTYDVRKVCGKAERGIVFMRGSLEFI